ncbi:hypothetical protein HCU64_06690 [Methylobacterium sp. C25]|uniref:hypothetical protein n=1 Tax=Methylobacterium sp. C25 TaxID=2721622 RepID=UPI001F1693CC|nr:hypothetical protein [Methylobacterium sp. C25]MCE4223433.1 hypothetical protein [Methylobacterium sp. C25]
MSAVSFIPEGLSDRLSMLAASGKVMKQSRVNAPTVVGDERTVVADRTIDFLRRLHPQKTAENVAADTGIAAATVARWMDRGSAPNSAAFLKLLGAYGPELLCATMDNPASWIDRACREIRRERIRTEINALEQAYQETAA